jgi:hypothetical protein
MKRIFLGVIAFMVMSATLYADGGKSTVVKSKSDCCNNGCCKSDCTNAKPVYAAKRGLIVLKGGGCTCC